MIEVDFELRRTSACGSIDALLVESSDVRRLCVVLEGGRLDARIFVLARCHADASPAGFLALLATPLERPPAGAVALRRVGSRLFIPRDAQLAPAATESEVDALLDTRVQLLLPGGRRHAFDPASARAIEQLFECSPRAVARWDRARPGVRLAPRIVAVELTEKADLASFFDEPAQQIGSERVEQIPPSEDELELDGSKAPLVRRWFATAALQLAKRAPQIATQATWIDRVAKWAQRVLESDLQAKREREIRRLLKLLEADPQLGLKYALPMGGSGGRGNAPPSHSLGLRRAEFDARTLGGGGATDVWSLPPEQRRDLLQRYTDLAQQETALGRHRRAAYIYAHLLGDLRAAARVLAEGRHHREAAALWLERLDEPGAAAECLERGGFVEEALELWTARQNWWEAAELLERLGRGAEAREMWRRAVSQLDLERNLLFAATVLETKLGDVEGAIERLAADWPDGPAAESRRLRWMRVLDRQNREREVVRWIEEQAVAARDMRSATVLSRLLFAALESGLARTVQESAAFELRSVVGRSLVAHGRRANRLVGLLTNVLPDDSLLRRDGSRYRHVSSAAASKPALLGPFELTRDFSIRSLAHECCAFASTQEFLFVVRPSSRRESPSLECWSWRTGEQVQSWHWPAAPAIRAKPWIHVVEQGRELRVLVGPLESEVAWRGQARRVVEGFRITAGAPEGFPSRVLGIAGAPNGDFVVLTRTERGDTRLIGFDAHLGLRGAVYLEHDELLQTARPTALAMHEASVLLGLGPHGARNDSRFAKPCFLGFDVRAVQVVDRGGLNLTLLTTDKQLELVSLDSNGAKLDAYTEELDEPRATVLPSGTLVAVDRRTLVVARRDGLAYRRQHHLPALLYDVVEVLPTPHVDSVALVAADGRVCVVRLGGSSV
jgi:hypothetical protein